MEGLGPRERNADGAFPSREPPAAPQGSRICLCPLCVPTLGRSFLFLPSLPSGVTDLQLECKGGTLGPLALETSPQIKVSLGDSCQEALRTLGGLGEGPAAARSQIFSAGQG